MTRLLRIGIVLVVLSQAAISQQGASIQGIVVRAGTNEPLGKATIELQGGGTIESTMAEPDGRFFFFNLAPGVYELKARRDGFGPAEYGQRWSGGPGVPITVKAGQQMSGVQLPLTPTASMSGRVSDSNGQPLANVQVQALKSSFLGELRVLVPVQQVRTTETGAFRLYGLPAGRYYVNVAIPPAGATQILLNSSGRMDPAAPYSSSSQPRSALAQSGASTPADNGPIYFPSTANIQDAAPIDLQPGGEYRGLNIRMMPGRNYSVCGVVRNLPPAAQMPPGARGISSPPPPAQAANPARPATDPCGTGSTGRMQSPVGSVMLLPLDVELRAALSAPGNRYNAPIDGVTGQFVIRNVLPGRYELSTNINNMVGSYTLDVRDRDVENVPLALQSGSPLPTRITVDGGTPEVQNAVQGLSVVIGSDPPYQGRSPSQTSPADGKFVIENVSPRDRRVYVVPILNSILVPDPPTRPNALKNVYVKSAKLGGIEILNTGFIFGGEPDKTLEIVLGVNAGTLTGRVEDDRNQPAPGVFVRLIPDARSVRLFRTDMHRTASTDAEGRFEITGLPPGGYKVFALEGFEKDSWLDPEFFKPYEDRGVSVEIGEGQTQSLQTPLNAIRR